MIKRSTHGELLGYKCKCAEDQSPDLYRIDFGLKLLKKRTTNAGRGPDFKTTEAMAVFGMAATWNMLIESHGDCILATSQTATIIGEFAFFIVATTAFALTLAIYFLAPMTTTSRTCTAKAGLAGEASKERPTNLLNSKTRTYRLFGRGEGLSSLLRITSA